MPYRFILNSRLVSATQANKNERLTMTGSKTNLMTRDQVLAAINAISPSQDFVWDGVNEDEKPATEEELKTAFASRSQRLEADKTQILLQVDKTVLQAFRASGQDWQNQMNNALKEWLKTHPVIRHL